MERSRSRVRWWTQVPNTAIDSAPAALTGTPAAPFARAPPSRCPSAGADARWLERGTRDRAGTRAGSDAALGSCARRFGSVWRARAWRRWWTPATCVTRRVEFDAAAVGCTAVDRAAGAALAAGVQHTAPASTIEAITIRVGELTSRSIDACHARCIRNAQTPAGFHVNCVGWARVCANLRFHYACGVRSPIRVLVLLSVLAVIVAAAYALRGSFSMPVREHASGADVGAPLPGMDADTGEDVVARALRLAAIDTTRKREWVEDIPDLELAALAPPARETFLRIANGRRCNCGCGFTLAGCRRFDSECEKSGPRARALYDSVRAGQITSATGFPERPAAPKRAALRRPNGQD
jgi:hypothetical protein